MKHKKAFQKRLLPIFALSLGLLVSCEQEGLMSKKASGESINEKKRLVFKERLNDLDLPADFNGGSFKKHTPPQQPAALQQLRKQVQNQDKNNTRPIPHELKKQLNARIEEIPSNSGNGIISVKVKGKRNEEDAIQNLLKQSENARLKSSQVAGIGYSDVYAYPSPPYDYGNYYAETRVPYTFQYLDVYSDLYINGMYQTSILDYQYNDFSSYASALGQWSPSYDYNCFSMYTDHYANDPSTGVQTDYTTDIDCS